MLVLADQQSTTVKGQACSANAKKEDIAKTKYLNIPIFINQKIW